MSKKVLLTGGAGYIGSHIAVQLLNIGLDVVIVDNFSNSSPEVIRRIESLTGKHLYMHNIDVCDIEQLNLVFEQHGDLTDVIHLAGKKSVGESVSQPLSYYQNNLIGLMSLLQVMQQHSVHSLVFSSSATVYAVGSEMPLTESSPRSAINPYGQTKLMSEYIIEDFVRANPQWKVAILRYFNPVGAHSSGVIGESPNGVPNNLMPYISQVAIGSRPFLNVFGNDYDTPDGTGVRDYIHVEDLAQGHLSAMNFLSMNEGVHAFNLGTGIGTSVLDLVHAFQRISKQQIPIKVTERRHGDIATCYASPDKSNRLLKWSALKTIDDMVSTAWIWQQKNPQGY